MADRVCPGGVATISLGEESSKDILLERQREREAVFETPEAVARFTQAPGGTSSIRFGESGQEPAPSARTAVGGVATICLGTEDSSAAFKDR
eukprot:CAMPEP_0176120238 /NCGR_PEP_ID=MMETSP0120_2-20121206/60479_1 /TAXON_ID=160619 /ORGANISM="Kryptoperidinium foliaceum, Strain CCMP 1326" /LENGTH=91 /DNA_ID=CAMNT_0017454691 /DNA_START=95 /DNA_END=367 /DNA_ORIENTATION=-